MYEEVNDRHSKGTPRETPEPWKCLIFEVISLIGLATEWFASWEGSNVYPTYIVQSKCQS